MFHYSDSFLWNKHITIRNNNELNCLLGHTLLFTSSIFFEGCIIIDKGHRDYKEIIKKLIIWMVYEQYKIWFYHPSTLFLHFNILFYDLKHFQIKYAYISQNLCVLQMFVR